MSSKGVELELPAEIVAPIAEAFGFAAPPASEQGAPHEPSEEPSDEEDDGGLDEDFDATELQESVTTKRLNGHIVLSGFDDKVVGSIPQELKFRILAHRHGSRIRLIVDVKA